MIVRSLISHQFNENTYLVYEQEGGECLLIDCGAFGQEEEERLRALIEQLKLTPKRLLTTHFHIDHVVGNAFALRQWGLRAETSPQELMLWQKMHYQLMAFGMDESMIDPVPSPLITLDEGVEVILGNIHLQCLHTPGHSPGSLSFYCPDEGALFSGDTLLKGAYGNVNLPGGRRKQLRKTITERLFALPPHTTVYTGHGDITTIAQEIGTNPILTDDGANDTKRYGD